MFYISRYLLALFAFKLTIIYAAENDLQECSISKIPAVEHFFSCRRATTTRINLLKEYWSSEDDAELCHYFYFPLSDPTATKELLLENYLIMQNEISLREIDCIKDHRNIFWYRGNRTKSMLEKLIIKYDLQLDDD